MNLRVVLLNVAKRAVILGGLGVTSLQSQTGVPAAPGVSGASSASGVVWRCGQLLTNQPQPGVACEPMSTVATTVVEGTRVNGGRSAGASGAAARAGVVGLGSSVSSAATTSSSSVPMPSHQQARALLQAELHEQTQRWQQLHTQWNQGRPIATAQQPEGSPAYLERVATLREQLQRTEADLAALRRELARLP